MKRVRYLIVTVTLTVIEVFYLFLSTSSLEESRLKMTAGSQTSVTFRSMDRWFKSFAHSLPGKPIGKPEQPIDDSGGPEFPGNSPENLPGNFSGSAPDNSHFNVPSFEFPSLNEDAVDDSLVPLNYNDSGANYDYNDIKDGDPSYEYNDGYDDYEESTESALEGNTTHGSDYSEEGSPDYEVTETPHHEEETADDEPEVHEESTTISAGYDTEGQQIHDKPEGFDEPAEAHYHHPTAKRLTSPTVKAYIAPIFDLGKKSYSGPSLMNSIIEPLKYSMPTIGHHKNEPFHSPLVDDIYDDHDGYRRNYPKKHNKGGGSSYDSGYHSSHGDKDDKGYNSHHDFHEGEHGHHGKEGKKGYYNDKSGHKNNYHDGANHYGAHHANEHGKKGSQYGETGHHKKGHKTTGYHNTYHKDEFKKEHKFYDDAHKEGYHDKHGAYHADHGKHSGGKKHGGYHDSAYNEGHKGKSGFYDKGHFDNEHAGHKGAAGYDSHFGNFDEFGKKSGFNDHNKFGFSDF